MSRRLSITVLCALLSSCASDPDRYNRAYVSPELEQRTGSGIGPERKPDETAIPDSVDLKDGISEDEAVAVALWNNAAFQEALAELGLRRADLIQAGLLPNPVFSTFLPLGPKQLEFTATLPLEAFFFRHVRVAAAELECERVAALLVEGGLNLVRDVRTAYADLLLARQRASLAEETLTLRNRIADYFLARLRAGAVSELEASRARIAALQAERERSRLAHEVVLAQERLRALLGFATERAILHFNEQSPEVTRIYQDEDALLEDALAARPDLRAAELAIEAASKRAGLAGWEFIALSGIVDANEEGSSGFEIGPGLELEIPLFDWNEGGVARADAELERAVRRYVTMRHAVAREVAEAHARFLQGSEALETWRARIVPSLEVARGQAQTAYEKGETSILPVLETDEELLSARLLEAEATTTLRQAKAQLERSIGRRLVPRPGDQDG